MRKIEKILIGTNNIGKYTEIRDLLPKKVKKYSPQEFKILSPDETGNSFEENSFLKASYFSKKTNLACLSDDSGLEIDILKGAPGIYSSRWSGKKNNFDLAINRIFKEMKIIREDWENENTAKFVCCLTLFLPNGQNYLGKGVVNGRISKKKEEKMDLVMILFLFHQDMKKLMEKWYLNTKCPLIIDTRLISKLKIFLINLP